MLSVLCEKIGDMAVIDCEGRIVTSQENSKFRDAVTSQPDAHIVVLDFSEVDYIADGGLGTLGYLQDWSCDHNIQLKLFNPTSSLRHVLEQANLLSELSIASLDEMMVLLDRAEHPPLKRAA